MQYDVIVIGSSAEGCFAALDAARRGLKVILFRDAHAERRTSESIAAAQLHVHAEQLLRVNSMLRRSGTGRFRRLFRESDLVAQARQRGRYYVNEQLRILRRVGVSVERGSVRFLSPTKVQRDRGAIYEARIVVIGSGGIARRTDGFRVDGSIVCDPASILRPGRPKHLVVAGAEDVGCEVGCIFAALGAKVTIVDRRRRFFCYLDREVLSALHVGMRDLGIELVLEEEIAALRIEAGCSDAHAIVELASGRSDRCDRVLLGSGSVPDLGPLAIEAAGVKIDSAGFVLVDEFQGTSQPGVYAVGEVATGVQRRPPVLQGRVAIEHAIQTEVDTCHEVPLAIRTIPSIAMTGLSEEMCQRLDRPYEAASVRFSELPHVGVGPKEAGLLKLVVAKDSEEVIGVHAIGEGAFDLIQPGAFAVARRWRLGDISEGAVLSGSLGEAYWIAAERVVDALRSGRSAGPSGSTGAAIPVDARGGPGRTSGFGAGVGPAVSGLRPR